MVKASRVLDTEVPADVAYEDTPLAKRALGARRRLRNGLLLGALLLLVDAGATRSVLLAALAAAVALTAWRVPRGRLPPLVWTGLEALAAVLLALWAALLGGWGLAEGARVAATLLLVAVLAPTYVLLLRDAELQHAYGRWARRGGLGGTPPNV